MEKLKVCGLVPHRTGCWCQHPMAPPAALILRRDQHEIEETSQALRHIHGFRRQQPLSLEAVPQCHQGQRSLSLVNARTQLAVRRQLRASRRVAGAQPFKTVSEVAPAGVYLGHGFSTQHGVKLNDTRDAFIEQRCADDTIDQSFLRVGRHGPGNLVPTLKDRHEQLPL